MEDLKQRVERLERELGEAERLATVGLTAAGLAHTIKNILGGLEGAMYTVDTAMERDDRARLRLGWSMVRSYIEQVDALVWNLLHYARESEPRRELRDPGELVREVEALYTDKASLVGVRLDAEVEDGLPQVSVDPQVIHACLANLVTNGVDACTWDPDEGKERRVMIAARAGDGGAVVFEVRDTGTGIPEEHRDKVLATSFSTKGLRGTGLGLLLTRKAVIQHGGAIRFETTPGQGTSFEIELPAGDEADPG